MSDSTFIRLHAIVEGRVQGVGFRYFAQRQAIENNINGWVRNRWNRTVELVAEGEKQDVEKFLKAISRGPRSGTTQKVQTIWEEPSNQFASFQIRMTA